MTFSNLTNSVNTGNGILGAVDFKIFLGSMPLGTLIISYALGTHSVHSSFVTVAATGDLTAPLPPHFLSFRRPCLIFSIIFF